MRRPLLRSHQAALLVCCMALALLLTGFPRILPATQALDMALWVDDDYGPSTPGWGATHFASIPAALDVVVSGGTIYVSEGLYQGTVQVNTAGVFIEGVGATENILLDGNGASHTVGILANGVTFSRMSVTGAAVQGIRIVANAGVLVTECIVSGNGCIGIDVVGGQGHKISRNDVRDNRAAGQAIGIHTASGATEVLVEENLVSQHHDTLGQGTGILVEDTCAGTRIVGNVLTDNDFGVRVAESFDTLVRENLATEHLHSGIHVQDAVSTTLTANEIISNTGSGIMLVYQTLPELLEGPLAVVEGNTCRANQAAGIYGRGGGHLRFERNICHDNALHGIALESNYVTVTANSLVGNIYAGLRIYDLDPYTSLPLVSATAHGNILADNGLYGLQSQMAEDVDAIGNWWGTNTPLEGAQHMGAMILEPFMTLTAHAEPQAITIGGAASSVSAHCGGGGHKAPAGMPISLEGSAGNLLGSMPLLTVGGRVTTKLVSGDLVETAVVTATAHNAVVTTTVAFYDPQAYGGELALSVSAEPTTVCPGHNLTLHLNCANSGTETIHSVWVSDTMPAGTWPLLDESSPGATYDEIARTVAWQLGDLAAEESAEVELRVHSASSLNPGDVLTNHVVGGADEITRRETEISFNIAACASPTPSSTAAATITPTPSATATSPPTTTPSPTPTATPAEQDEGALQGTTWLDLNRNAMRDESEPTLEGVVIQLWYGQPSIWENPVVTQTSAQDGHYAFENLPAGQYCLKQVPPSGYLAIAKTRCEDVSQGQIMTMDWPSEPPYTALVPIVIK